MKLILFFIFSLSASTFAKIKVVTTTTDLKYLVTSVAGDSVEVSSIVKGTQDPHQIEAKPSFMVQMRNADLVISQGLELESAWLEPLIRGARNPKLNSGGKGLLQLGENLDPIEIPKAQVTRLDGDIHPGGNPHFQLDPLRMGKAAGIIAARLSELDPAHQTEYKTNATAFEKNLSNKTKEWKSRLEKSGVKEIVTYHKTFSYFLDRFGITNSLQLEPKPGIPPTASHIMEVIKQMKLKNLKVVFIENFFSDEVAEKLKQEIPGVHVNRVPVSIAGDPSVKSTEDLIELLVKNIEAAR